MSEGRMANTTTESNENEGHMAHDPTFVEPRRGLRGKISNRKYATDHFK